MWLISLISALSGALIGAVAGGRVTYYFNKKHAHELEEKQRAALAMALSTELKALLDLYINVCGKEIEHSSENKNTSPLTGILDISQNYFSVFDNVSGQLSLLNKDTALETINTYVNLKAFFEELVHYGNLTRRYYEACSGKPSIANMDEYKKTNKQIDDFFKYLQQRHFQITSMIKETTTLLDKLY